MQIMQVLDIIVGPNCYNFCVESNEHRIKLSDRSLSGAAKETRSSLKSARKDEEDENLVVEGQLYGPGIAD